MICRRLPLVLGFALAPLVCSASAHADPSGVAVIIGNRHYQGAVPEVSYAHRDAEAFKRYVLDALGYDPANVIDLRDATQAEMVATFGNEKSAEGNLWAYLDPAGGSDVVVFYSGHGVPGQRDDKGYLLPADADPNVPELNAYPIDLLYANLAKLTEAGDRGGVPGRLFLRRQPARNADRERLARVCFGSVAHDRGRRHDGADRRFRRLAGQLGHRRRPRHVHPPLAGCLVRQGRRGRRRPRERGGGEALSGPPHDPRRPPRLQAQPGGEPVGRWRDGAGLLRRHRFS